MPVRKYFSPVTTGKINILKKCSGKGAGAPAVPGIVGRTHLNFYRWGSLVMFSKIKCRHIHSIDLTHSFLRIYSKTHCSKYSRTRIHRYSLPHCLWQQVTRNPRTLITRSCLKKKLFICTMDVTQDIQNRVWYHAINWYGITPTINSKWEGKAR